jgi:hypothetical protein
MDDVEAIYPENFDETEFDELVVAIDEAVNKIYIPPAPPSPPVPTIEPAPPSPPVAARTPISKASKLKKVKKVKKVKKKWLCYKCGLNLASKEKLKSHMTSRNCKRLRSDDDESPEPHEAIGSNLKECLENYKKLKDKNFNDDKIL